MTKHVLSVAVGDALTYATINATILALLFAVAVALAVVAVQTLDSLTTTLFDKAHEINGVRSPTRWRETKHEPPAERSLDELLELIRAIATEEKFADDDMPPPSDRSARGTLLASCFGDVGATYPFASKDPSGEKTALSFATEADVETWLSDTKQQTHRCDVLLKASLLRMEGLVKDGVGDTLANANELNPDFIPPPVADFRRFISKASDIARETKSIVDQLNRYRGRLPARPFVITATVVATLIFSGSVVYPMLDTGAPTALTAWIPGLFYVCSLVSACVILIRRYPST